MTIDDLAFHEDLRVYGADGSVGINEAFVKVYLDESDDKVAATIALMDAWAAFILDWSGGHY